MRGANFFWRASMTVASRLLSIIPFAVANSGWRNLIPYRRVNWPAVRLVLSSLLLARSLPKLN